LLAAKSRQLSGTPLSVCSPRDSNSIPEPATRPFMVLETSTSPPPARFATRDAMWTVRPLASLPRTVASWADQYVQPPPTATHPELEPPVMKLSFTFCPSRSARPIEPAPQQGPLPQ
jgi:hypothetical protein